MQDQEHHARFLKFRAVRLLAAEATLDGSRLLARWHRPLKPLNLFALQAQDSVILPAEFIGERSRNSEFYQSGESGSEQEAFNLARLRPVSSTLYARTVTRPFPLRSSLRGSDTIVRAFSVCDSTVESRRPSVPDPAELQAGEKSVGRLGAGSAGVVVSPVVDFDHHDVSLCDEESPCPEGHFGGETGEVVDVAPAAEPDGAACEDTNSLAAVLAVENDTVYERLGCGEAATLGAGSVTIDVFREGISKAVHEICLRSVLQVI